MSPIETYDNTTQLRQDYVHHCLQSNITIHTRNYDSHHNRKNLLPVTKETLINHFPQRGVDNISPRLCYNRTRQLFGVQLEVTSLLLEAERRKLAVLQKELQLALEDGGSINEAKEQLHELILAISRIQVQYELLEKEYEHHAIGRLRCSNTRGIGKSNRSQPAIGLKQTPKARPTIFGTVADRCPKDGLNRRGFPQTTQSNSNVATEFCHPESDEHEKGSDLDDNALVYRDGNLISGSLDALLQHMVPTSDYYPDKSYLFAFLLSARLFIRPHELLTKISQLCDIQQSLTPSTQSQCTTNTQELSRFAKHFVQLLAEWIETFPYDFRDDRLMQQVRSMTQKCINVDGNLRKEVSAMLQNLLHRLNVLDQYEEHLGRMNVGTDRDDLTSSSSSSSSHLPATSNSNSFNTSIHSTSLSIGPTSGTSSGDITELCPSPTLLSHQLTHIELERLSHIGPEEFVQAFAKENPHLETSFNDMKKTRNLESYVQWFNRLSYLVATEIVKHPKKKQRIRVVEYWIETGRECFNIGNFNSLMAIIAGLNMSPISRLKKTWAKVQTAKFSVLEHQMDPTSNFNSYRSTLKAAMWRSAGATDERQRIVIPFFSLLVKDLYFLNEGCSNKLPNGHINFDKFWQLAKQVTEFIAWKQVTCTFEKLPKVILFLQTNHVLNENTLAMASFECEPPDNQHEKDRYKLLKSEQNQH